jgi:hypothetical protein
MLAMSVGVKMLRRFLRGLVSSAALNFHLLSYRVCCYVLGILPLVVGLWPYVIKG